MTEHYIVDIIFNSRNIWDNNHIVTAKFQSGKSQTIFSKVECFDGWFDDEGKEQDEYCAVFHTKTNCYSFFLYIKDGELVKDKTWCHKEYYNKSTKTWCEEKKKHYYSKDNQITINEIIQQHLDE
jgi:hypothetical protein